MHDNRRTSQRFAINSRAKIHFGAGTLPRDCTIDSPAHRERNVLAIRIRLSEAKP